MPAHLSLAASSGTLSLLSVLVLGFILGMRHATDADHVVTVSTIVSRERHIGSAAWIGALWGTGHTITISAVGAGIILFTLVIPPRVGLSMELSVGLMLVLLGWVNLRGLGKVASDGSESVAGDAPRHPETHGSHRHTNVDLSVVALDHWFGHWTLYQWLRPGGHTGAGIAKPLGIAISPH